MRRPDSFLREAAFGFAVSLVASAVALTLGFVLAGDVVARVVIAGIGLTLVVRALGRSKETTGRMIVIGTWLAVSLALFWFGAALSLHIGIHLSMAWLVRSLYRYACLTEAMLDLGLTALAVSFATLAAVRTESLFLAVWCLLLVQGLHVTIPALATRLSAGRCSSADAPTPADDPNRAFADALKAADDALERLAART